MSNYPRVKLGKTEICNMTFFPFGIAIVWKDTPIWRKKDNAVRQNSCTNTSCSGQKRHWFWRHYGCIMDITVAYTLYDTATPKKSDVSWGLGLSTGSPGHELGVGGQVLRRNLLRNFQGATRMTGKNHGLCCISQVRGSTLEVSYRFTYLIFLYKFYIIYT